MKRNAKLLSLIIVFINFACGFHVEQNQEPNYIPPTVKSQPRLIYPKLAQENFYSGSSKIVMFVNKTGLVDKLYVTKSSGYEVLDKAALEYCKNLIFNPAVRNNEAVDARIVWDIKFNFSDKNLDANNYLHDMENLYRKISKAKTGERNLIEKEILNKHNEFITNMKDGLNFNIYISQVISPEITTEWEKDWNAFPLSFLLYHDFLKRFQDYDSISVVKNKLYNSLRSDIQYIKNTPDNDGKTKVEKLNILSKIKKFITRQYPDMVLDDMEIDWKMELQKFPSKIAI
jgi:TonB family protein